MYSLVMRYTYIVLVYRIQCFDFALTGRPDRFQSVNGCYINNRMIIYKSTRDFPTEQICIRVKVCLPRQNVK